MPNVQTWVSNFSGVWYLPSGRIRPLIRAGLERMDEKQFEALVVEFSVWGVKSIERVAVAGCPIYHANIREREAVVVFVPYHQYETVGEYLVPALEWIEKSAYKGAPLLIATPVTEEREVEARGKKIPVLSFLYETPHFTRVAGAREAPKTKKEA